MSDSQTLAKEQPRYTGCFVCGTKNPIGLKVVFYNDDKRVWTEFTPGVEHQGYPGIMHGGILYTLLDETIGRAAYLREMWVMTARMQVRYRHPVPTGSRLRIEGEIVRVRGRVVEANGRALLADGTVAAEASGLFMEIPPPMLNGLKEQVLEQPPEETTNDR
jgi:acyl-coenzyme A thioesterase PaaI-like protein